MKKVLLTLTLLLVISCSKSDKEYVENCADQKTSRYWNERKNEFIKEQNRWTYKLSKSSDKYEQKSILLMIKDKQYYIDLYSNASKKKLDEKLYEFPRFENNFKICEKKFQENPIYFKQIYK